MATKSTAATVDSDSDKVEDGVLNMLPTLDATELEEICDLIGVAVKDSQKGKRRLLVRLLMSSLCVDEDDGDDKMTEFLQIHKHLKLDENDDSDEGDSDDDKKTNKGDGSDVDPDADKSPAVKVEEDDSKSSLSSGANAKKKDSSGAKKKDSSAKSKSAKSKGDDRSHEKIRAIRKEFKLPGMIGGTSATALTYSSLKFEIAKGRKQGYDDPEICLAIISKVADKELKEYFENEPDMGLDDVLEMLKCVCKPQKSSTAFTTFTNDKQGPNEKPSTFITRVLRLRKRVLTLAKEEGRTYLDSTYEEMLKERAFEVIFGGLRDENVRSALRDKLRNDTSLTDMQILKHMSDVVGAEDERKAKLFGKVEEEESVEVNEVQEVRDERKEKKDKKKLNPFAEIDELRTEIRKRDDHVDAQLSEIKQLLLKNNGQSDDADKSKKSRRKCPQCFADNKFRCRHCWDCGADDHRRLDPNCPENK